MSTYKLKLTTEKESELVDITARVKRCVAADGTKDGICSVFSQSPDAGLSTSSAIAPVPSISVPIVAGRLMLGSGQGLFLAEASGPQDRSVLVTVY